MKLPITSMYLQIFSRQTAVEALVRGHLTLPYAYKVSVTGAGHLREWFS